jgi:hypothetical protein
MDWQGEPMGDILVEETGRDTQLLEGRLVVATG